MWWDHFHEKVTILIAMGGIKRKFSDSNVDGAGPRKYKKKKYPYDAKSMLAKLKILQSRIRAPEKKENQTFQGSFAIDSNTPTTMVQLLNGIAQGTSEVQRLGNVIQSEYIDMKIAIRPDANTVGGDYGFWAIVLDRQTNGAAPAFSNMFDTTTITTVGLAPRNTVDYPDRFKIICMESWAANNTANPGGSNPYFVHQFINLAKQLRGKDRKVSYLNNAAPVTSMASNAIYLVIACNRGTAAQPTLVSVGVKYRFTDA